MALHRTRHSFPNDYDLRDGVYGPRAEEGTPFQYNDGDAAETYLLDFIRKTADRSVLSQEISAGIRDWPSLYHLSPKRANLLRPFASLLRGDILEVGAGCGAVTRFLGENGGTVLALEGSARRAHIARERTADLSNVTVVCQQLEAFSTAKQFDAILSIGVLEYAAIYSSDKNQPHVAFLENLRQRLSSDGVVILAIENKLGLKYFAGAREDHVGSEFHGINDGYSPASVATFGRAELAALLSKAGLPEQAFFYPCPDYKLPVTMLSDALLERNPDLAATLLAQSAIADPQRPSDPTFSLEQGWTSLSHNQLLGSLANSFLVVAGRTADAIARFAESTDIGWHYAVDRHPAFARETRFETSPSSLRVKRRALSEAPSPAVPVQCLTIDEPFHPGDNWWNALAAILNRPNWSIPQLSEWARFWLDALAHRCKIDHFGAHAFSTHVDGTHFDATPFNLVRDANGTAHFFDQEWQLTPTVEFGYVVYRGLRDSLARVSSCAKPAAGTPIRINDLVVGILAECGVLLTRPDIDRYALMEGQIQAWVQGRSASTMTATDAANYWTVALTERQPVQRDALAQEARSLRGTIDETRSKFEASEQQRHVVSQELARATDTVKSQADELSRVTNLAAEREQSLAGLTRDLENTRRFLADSQQQTQSLAGELSQAHDELARLRERAVQNETERKALVKNQQDLQAQLDQERDARQQDAAASQRQLVEEREAHQRDTAALQRQLAEERDGHTQTRALHERVRTERDAATARVSDLDQRLSQERDVRARETRSLNDQLGRERSARAADARTHDAKLRDLHEAQARDRQIAKAGADQLATTLAMQAREIDKLNRSRFRLPLTGLVERLQRAVTPWKRTRFRNRAWEAGIIRASRLFRPLYYLERYPDVAAADIDPLLHYIQHGAAEGRIPHPLFDPDFYWTQVPEAERGALSPLAHFASAGVVTGLDPHPLFGTDFYLRANPDVATAGVNPLQHFMEHGWREGRDPNPLFDTSFYLDNNPALATAGTNPLLHYLAHGPAGARPSL